jgi:hypothetical protein
MSSRPRPRKIPPETRASRIVRAFGRGDRAELAGILDEALDDGDEKSLDAALSRIGALFGDDAADDLASDTMVAAQTLAMPGGTTSFLLALAVISSGEASLPSPETLLSGMPEPGGAYAPLPGWRRAVDLARLSPVGYRRLLRDLVAGRDPGDALPRWTGFDEDGPPVVAILGRDLRWPIATPDDGASSSAQEPSDMEEWWAIRIPV